MKGQREEHKKRCIEEAKSSDIPSDIEEREAFIKKSKTEIDAAKSKFGLHTANYFAFEYMSMYPGQYVLCKEVQEYCSVKTKEIKGEVLGDPPRAFEMCRKNYYPLEWDEQKVGRLKLVRFNPDKKGEVTDQVYKDNCHKHEGFSKGIIQEKMLEAGFKCEITGLPVSDGALAADHFYPREKGGESIKENCVILNKILNEKKNNQLPVYWFSRSILTNFLKVSSKVGTLEKTKEELLEFIKNYN